MKVIFLNPSRRLSLSLRVTVTLCVIICVFAASACDKSRDITPLDETDTVSSISNTNPIDETDNIAIQGTCLQGSTWKFVEFGDIENGTTKIPEPNCEECYILTFDTDTTLSTVATTARQFGGYEANCATNDIHIFNFGGTKLGERDALDGRIYRETFYLVKSFSIQNNELKLFYNDNKNYLLFKLLKP